MPSSIPTTPPWNTRDWQYEHNQYFVQLVFLESTLLAYGAVRSRMHAFISTAEAALAWQWLHTSPKAG